MPILKSEKRNKRIDLTKYFGEEAYVTIKYINRDIWRYANRLTLKTSDALLYNEIVNNKEYKEIQKRLDNAKTSKEKIEIQKELNDKANELLALKYDKITKQKLDETLAVETEKNKILIEHGIDQDEHNLFDDKGNKIKLNYEILQNTPFFDYIINEIISFNGSFDLGE